MPAIAETDVFEHVTISPRTYNIGGGRQLDATPELLKEYAKNTKQALNDGLSIPVPGVHPDQNHRLYGPSPNGQIPLRAAGDSINNAGWVKDISADDKGNVHVKLKITNKDYRDRVKDGSIKFSSPQFVPKWEIKGKTTGTDRSYGPMFSHIALVPNPRNDQQEALKPVAFSEIEDEAFSVELAFEDFDETTKPPTDGDVQGQEEKPEQPELTDIPSISQTPGTDQAILANLAALGVMLPDGWEMSSGDPDVMLAALKTAVNAETKKETEKAAEKAEEETPMPVQQFADGSNESEDEDVENTAFSEDAQKVINGQKARLDKLEREKVTAQLDDCKLPGLASKIRERADSIGFADDGTEQAVFTASELIGMINESVPETMTFDDSNVAVADPPKGHSPPDADGGQTTEEINADLDRLGFKRKQVWTNPNPDDGMGR